MSHPVVTLRGVENVGHIVELLKLTSYNGFPVVDPPLSDQVTIIKTKQINNNNNNNKNQQSEVTTYGRIRGLILRWQLIVILQMKLFNETSDCWGEVNAGVFRDEYPRYPTIDVSISFI